MASNKPKKTQKFNPKKINGRDVFYSPFGAIDLIVPFLPAGASIFDPCCGTTPMIVNRLNQKGFSAYGTDLAVDPFIDIFDIAEQHKELLEKASAVVVNPFYSGKARIYKLLRHVWKIPFSMLIPTDDCAWTMNAITKDDCRWVKPSDGRRINYITPNILDNIKYGELYILVRKKYKGKYKSIVDFRDSVPRDSDQFLFYCDEFDFGDKHNYESFLDVPDKWLAKYSSSQFFSGWLTWGLNVPEKLTIVEFSVKQQKLMVGNQ